MNEDQLKERTKQLAIKSIQVVQDLPSDSTVQVLGRQLVRSATSVGANYRAACRARSGPEMLAKLGLVVEEADESQYWLELLAEVLNDRSDGFAPLHREFNEIVAICVASRKSLHRRLSETRGERE